MKKLANASVILANYPLLKQDFPQLRTFSFEEIDEWIIEHTAYIAETQIRYGEQVHKNGSSYRNILNRTKITSTILFLQLKLVNLITSLKPHQNHYNILTNLMFNRAFFSFIPRKAFPQIQNHLIHLPNHSVPTQHAVFHTHTHTTHTVSFLILRICRKRFSVRFQLTNRPMFRMIKPFVHLITGGP